MGHGTMEAIDGDEAAAVLGNDAMVTMTTEDVDLYSPGAADGVPDAAERAASRNSSHDTVTGDEDTATVLPGKDCLDTPREATPTAEDSAQWVSGDTLHAFMDMSLMMQHCYLTSVSFAQPRVLAL